MTDLIGHSLGRYHILEQLGEGGMAIVYKARDTRLEADVAVKIIRTENILPSALGRTLKRFEREAKALARLTHPNIVKVTDYGEHEGKPYLVMPLLSGGTLKSKLNGKSMSWQDALRILIPMADALGYAHKHDIIHRDVKPANILITENGQPMLADFGVAKILDVEETMELTGTGVGIGTPEYMAPEQVTNKLVDARIDIYALGVVFYEMVTGRKPFIADTPMGVLFKHASEPLPRPRQFVPGLPQTVENVIIKALAKNPENRYQTMPDFVKALEGLSDGKPVGKKISAPKNGEVPAREKSAEFKLSALPRRAVITVGLMALGVGLIAAFSSPLKALPAILFPIAIPTKTPAPSYTSTPSITFTPVFTSTPSKTPTPRFSATPLPDEITDKSGVSMRLVPAGEFSMGNNDGLSSERPVHAVYLDAYYMDTYEVTNALYADCVNAGVCSEPKNISSYKHAVYYGKSDFVDYPVIYVDWAMADAYCKWRGSSLPTEAQWEKAARGVNNGIYPWGAESPNAKLLNFDRNFIDARKVGAYPTGISPHGLYDMAGNVSEWVNDWYDYVYYQNSPSSNPPGPDTGKYKVLRGGSWSSINSNVRATVRNWHNPADTNYDVGFRCVRGSQ
jgi:serine/threonine-protein kinase